MRLDERFRSLEQIDKLSKSVSDLLKKHAHRAFNWPKYACINFDVKARRSPVHVSQIGYKC